MDMETLTVFRYTITFLALFFWVTTYYGIITNKCHTRLIVRGKMNEDDL
jgi:hypothetical protein